LGFLPDATQARVLDSTGKRVLINCTRQWGKSTMAAARAVMEAATREESLTVVVSPSARQSGEFVRKAAKFVRKLGSRVRGDGDNEMSLLLPNGSRIVGLPGSEETVRGFSAVSLLLVDEAARVEDEMYAAVRPMQAVSDGTVWLMSTPWGRRGFFWEAWAKGGPEWERVTVPAAACGRISAKFLAEQRWELGERAFRREYCCEFVEGEDAVFDWATIDAAFRDEVEGWRNTLATDGHGFDLSMDTDGGLRG
jgi:hypothetical protein